MPLEHAAIEHVRMSPMRQIILDTETTGLSWERGNRVVEIGCVELVERRPTGRTFHVYLKPECEFEPGAQEVHRADRRIPRRQAGVRRRRRRVRSSSSTAPS